MPKSFETFVAEGGCAMCGSQRCDGSPEFVAGCEKFQRWKECENVIDTLKSSPRYQSVFGKRKRPPLSELIANKQNRINKDEYYLGIAEAVLKRSTCLRRKYGAVIVKDDVIVSTGYNGSARGEDNCCDLGKCIREELNVPKGERYELCVAIHAEDNAIMAAGRSRCLGATLYICGQEMDGSYANPSPCLMCARKIKNAGIERVCGRDKDGAIISIPIRP